MTAEAQQLTIVEACGLCIFQGTGRFENRAGTVSEFCVKCGRRLGAHELPDYLNDLNAMRKAWGILNAPQRARFAEEMAYVVLSVHNDPKCEFVFSRCSLSLFANGTAAQRAEAFLKTIGKWIE